MPPTPRRRAALLAWLALLTPLPARAEPPLIPREALFGNPVKTAAKLSPDGLWLSWLAPVDGVLNIWVAPTADPAAARPITRDHTRPIREYYWAPDNRSLLYLQDKAGDENTLLYTIDPRTGAERTLTPFPKTQVRMVGISSTITDRILIGINARDARFHDIFSLDLATGKLTEVLRNQGGYASFTPDDTLAIRLAARTNAAGGSDWFEVSHGRVAKRPLTSSTLEDSLTTDVVGYTADGRTLYWLDSRGRNTSALYAQVTRTGQRTLIGADPRADIDSAMTSPATGKLEAYKVDYLRKEWHPLNPAIAAALAFLKAHLPGDFPGDFEITSRTRADDTWLVTADPVTAPPATWLYDRKAATLTRLFVSRPQLEGAPLAGMVARELTARDGLTLVSYLTLPAGTDPAGTGIPDHPVPLVLYVHGGPWGRDSFGTDRTRQWLANRGYAVLSVNFRGSTGFGKAFLNAGNLQWGLKMQDDLNDAVDWAVASKITTPDKIAIMGGSYGGYATLAALTLTPTKFACGVDVVGPSNLETLLKTIPPYWTAALRQFHQRIGDPTTPAGLAAVKAASPLTKASQIARPLLIGQGANDPRVNKAESDQIVSAMKAHHIPVTYVLFPDEGHGFARPANNIAFNAVTENFLAGCLGGRAEPVGDALAKSSAQVLEGG